MPKPLRITPAHAAALGLLPGKRVKAVRLCVECQRRPALKVPRGFPGCSECWKSYIVAVVHPAWERAGREGA